MHQTPKTGHEGFPLDSFSGIKIVYLPFMKTSFLILLIVMQTPLFAQLKCRTVTEPDGSEVKKCFHQNGKVSITESWDKDKRSGSLKVFNNQGKEVCSYNLRHFGGHASASLSWFPNGQVKSVAYSDAPDGGIQYYHSTRQFDEVGNETSFTEDSYDDKLRIPPVTVRDTVKPRRPLVEINRVLEKPKTKRVDFLIINKTKSTQKVALDYSVIASDTMLRIGGKQEASLCIFQSEKDQELTGISALKLMGNTKRYEIIRGKEEELENRKVLVWYIIRN